MPAGQPPDLEVVRCRNARCPTASSGGHILFERGRSFFRVRLRLRGGTHLDVTGMVPVSAVCPSCGRPWINPDLVAADGLAGRIQQTLTDAASRVGVELDDSGKAVRSRVA